jgi:addiction module HigA family antidote
MNEIYDRGVVTRAPTHPGAILRDDVLPALNISKAAFARTIHVSRQMLYDILNEQRPITTAMALRLGKVLGNGPNVWAGMQQNYDLYHVAKTMADELEQMQVMHG